MTSYLERDHFKSEDVFKTGSQKFMMAFALEDYFTKETKHDPSYVKWFARYYVNKNGEISMREIPTHVCTD